MNDNTYSGFIALVGRPNVGKSTLLNKLIGQKLSITSKKPQTTRHRILGIDTCENYQLVYLDSPGIHLSQKKAINQYMNQAVFSVIYDADVVVLIIEALKWTDLEDNIINKFSEVKVPVILCVNKVDKVKEKESLLPFIDKVKEKYAFREILLISAKHGQAVDALKTQLKHYLPAGPFYYQEDAVTDRPMRFIVSEMVREKVFRLCGQELPYGVTVDIEQFKVESPKLTRISALIYVDKESHKRMIIGHKGEKLKQIGQAARQEIETLLETKVFLQLWCKVKSGWADNEKALSSLGYD